MAELLHRRGVRVLEIVRDLAAVLEGSEERALALIGLEAADLEPATLAPLHVEVARNIGVVDQWFSLDDEAIDDMFERRKHTSGGATKYRWEVFLAPMVRANALPARRVEEACAAWRRLRRSDAASKPDRVVEGLQAMLTALDALPAMRMAREAEGELTRVSALETVPSFELVLSDVLCQSLETLAADILQGIAAGDAPEYPNAARFDAALGIERSPPLAHAPPVERRR